MVGLLADAKHHLRILLSDYKESPLLSRGGIIDAVMLLCIDTLMQ